MVSRVEHCRNVEANWIIDFMLSVAERTVSRIYSRAVSLVEWHGRYAICNVAKFQHDSRCGHNDDDDDDSRSYVRPLLQLETVTSVLVICPATSHSVTCQTVGRFDSLSAGLCLVTSKHDHQLSCEYDVCRISYIDHITPMKLQSPPHD